MLSTHDQSCTKERSVESTPHIINTLGSRRFALGILGLARPSNSSALTWDTQRTDSPGNIATPNERYQNMSKTASLALAVADPTSKADQPQGTYSPTSPRTSTSLSTSPDSPSHDFFKVHNLSSDTADSMGKLKLRKEGSKALEDRPTSPKKEPKVHDEPPPSPGFTSLPPHPTSPTATPGRGRGLSRPFFSNSKAAKSSSRIIPSEATLRQVSEDGHSENENPVYALGKSQASTHDLTSLIKDEVSSDRPNGNPFHEYLLGT